MIYCLCLLISYGVLVLMSIREVFVKEAIDKCSVLFPAHSFFIVNIMLIPLSVHILGNVSLLGESDPIPHFVQSNVAVFVGVDSVDNLTQSSLAFLRR